MHTFIQMYITHFYTEIQYTHFYTGIQYTHLYKYTVHTFIQRTQPNNHCATIMGQVKCKEQNRKIIKSTNWMLLIFMIFKPYFTLQLILRSYQTGICHWRPILVVFLVLNVRFSSEYYLCNLIRLLARIISNLNVYCRASITSNKIVVIAGLTVFTRQHSLYCYKYQERH